MKQDKMNKINARRRDRARDGSTLTTTIMLTTIVAASLGSVIAAVSTHQRINDRSYELDRAFFLAEAGISAALVNLNSGGDGVIPSTNSQAMFANSVQFYSTNWGFETTISNLGSGQRLIQSTGYDNNQTREVVLQVSAPTTGLTVHALFEHALYAGNSSGDTNYVLDISGTGTGADFVEGDTYSGNRIVITGDALLRNPETFVDDNGDGLWNAGEEWTDVHVESGGYSNWPTVFTGPLSAAAFAAYQSDVDSSTAYGNGRYDEGEAFMDTVGNGVYDTSESFTDLDGNGVWSYGDPFVDANSNGTYEVGESFVDMGNGVRDESEGYQDVNGNNRYDPPGKKWKWKKKKKKWVLRNCWSCPGEPFSDEGNGIYDLGESFTDLDGTYDPGEPYVDDRNQAYDHGTQAADDITGMPTATTGLFQAVGFDAPIHAPNLMGMHYDVAKTETKPTDAYDNWGHDIDVAAQPFNGDGEIMDANNPAHIFVKNPDDRTYTPIEGKDDYFIEDPTDPTSSWGGSISVPDPNGSGSLIMRLLDVRANGTNLLYYVDGNVYVHNPYTHIYGFRTPGVFLTIVAKGNITFSDELQYNGGTTNAQDMVCMIALKDPAEPNSGNIYMGDVQFGTGGDVHAMLYAENDFIDNNLGEEGQPYLSVFGNMTAGNQVKLDRSGAIRTRLDITLDERIRYRIAVPPGLPPGIIGQRSIGGGDTWTKVPGTWDAFTPL